MVEQVSSIGRKSDSEPGHANDDLDDMLVEIEDEVICSTADGQSF